MNMNPYLCYFSFAMAMVMLGVANSSSSSSATSRVMTAMGSQQRCNGSTIAECVADQGEEEEEELLMESEVSRRILAENKKYISYKVQGSGPACNANIYGDCIVAIDSYHRPCTEYNRCKRSPD